MKSRLVVHAALVLTWVLAAGAALAVPPSELPGARDPEVVSRYKGAVLQSAASERYASLRIPLGPGRSNNGVLEFDKAITVEGKVSAYYYVQPADVEPLEVFKNYQSALTQAGFSPLYSCELQACSKASIPEGYRSELLGSRRWSENRVNPGGGSSPRELRYWSGKASRNGNDVYVIVWVTEATSIWNASTATIVVVEPQALETGKVTATTSERMQKGLQADGRIALYAIYFDTGKASLKPESKAQLDEMDRLLKSQPALHLFIVGHTDNQGTVETNLQLSQHRAEAVVAALVSQYGADAKRLSARGVANFAPLSSNAEPVGQAKNRRVEMVMQ